MALLINLGKKGLDCHFNGHFVGCFIYAYAITLLAPSRDALNNMLDYVGSMKRHMIYYSMLLRPNLCFYRTYSTLFDKDVHFFGKPYRFC